MKYPRLAALVLASALCVARAQDEDRQRPPTEIPDFSNLDEYIYEPKSAVQLSFRFLSGAGTQFSGTGIVRAPEAALADASLANVAREYHDGYVRPDTRTTPRLDSSGNPFTDPQTGAVINDPIPRDGRTNTWRYENNAQLDAVPPGFVAFHRYSAEVIDSSIRNTETKSTSGLDLAVVRDMGKLFGDRFTWAIMAGMSVNDISARQAGRVRARVSTLTDIYSSFGRVIPRNGYTGPSSESTIVTDNQGIPQSVVVDTSVLISDRPVLRTEQETIIEADSTLETAVMNNWRLKGAYYTFRAGPQLFFPITAKLKASISAGVALLYAGTNYTVTQTFTPDLGDDIVETDTEAAYKLLPGMYADANLHYELTEKAGFFAGAIYQTASSYTQELNTTTAKYATKVDFANQNGFRAGMSVRF